jgi:ribosomal protein L37E
MSRMSEQRQGEASRGETIALVCPACGAAARRAAAHFCATCGRGLRERAYAPTDSLLASYHHQHRRPAMLFEAKTSGVRVQGKPERANVFDNEGNTAAAIALVLVCSALVPYIGILFCPLAVMAGGFGLFEARVTPHMGGSRLAACCIVFGFVIAGAQVLLWGLF